MRDLGHWEPDLDFSIDDYFGFVYKITNIQTQRSYIGRKQFHSYTRKKIKERKIVRRLCVNPTGKPTRDLVRY